MTLADEFQDDTDAILGDWEETFTVYRFTISRDSELKPVKTWASAGTFLGDWQPVSGRTMREEVGLQRQSDAVIICRVDEDIIDTDRIERSDGSWMYVNYIRKYEDHWTIYLTRTEGSD